MLRFIKKFAKYFNIVKTLVNQGPHSECRLSWLKPFGSEFTIGIMSRNGHLIFFEKFSFNYRTIYFNIIMLYAAWT